jgi:hypothetical protein
MPSTSVALMVASEIGHLMDRIAGIHALWVLEPDDPQGIFFAVHLKI